MRASRAAQQCHREQHAPSRAAHNAHREQHAPLRAAHKVHREQHAPSRAAHNFHRECHAIVPRGDAIALWALIVGTSLFLRDGSAACDADGTLHDIPCYPPEVVRTTLGAGDTFIAGFIHRRNYSYTLNDCLHFASRLAGERCGVDDFTDIRVDRLTAI